MTYDELELEAYLLEILEEYKNFDNMDDEELYELMSNVASYMDDDYEEAYEYVTQFGPIDKKRILALDLPRWKSDLLSFYHNSCDGKTSIVAYTKIWVFYFKFSFYLIFKLN